MRKITNYFTVLSKSLLFFSTVFTVPLVSASSDSWHLVEYAIFEHLNSDTSTLRYEVIDQRKIKPGNHTYLTDIDPILTSAQTLNLYSDVSSTDIPEFELSNAIERLKRAKDTRVLDSGAWYQQLSSEQKVLPLKIESGDKFESATYLQSQSLLLEAQQELNLIYDPLAVTSYELEGKLLLKKKRFVHAGLNVFLSEFKVFPYRELMDWFIDDEEKRLPTDYLWTPLDEDSSDIFNKGFTQVPLNTYQLKQTRRIKDGEIHYLDHPVVGVLVTVKSISDPYAIEDDFEQP